MDCDYNGIIKEVDNILRIRLRYEIGELNGQFIGIIMNPFMSFLHKHILLPKYHKMTLEQKEISNIFLAGKNIGSRPLIIYTKTNDIIHVNINIVCYDSIFHMKLEYIETFNPNMIYTSVLKPPITSIFTESNIDMMIIAIDIKDSTHALIKKGSIQGIELHLKFHKHIVELIQKRFYPYLYIHEIMGDGFILILNIEWAHNFPRFCASMAYSFLSHLYQLTNDFIEFRAGVSYGKLYYGYLDEHLRFFGEPINRAARYESICPIGHVCTEKLVYDKLIDEGMCDSHKIYPKYDSKYLRGLGQQDVIYIPYTHMTIQELNDGYKRVLQKI
jgi:hypothetical protein